MIGFLGEAYLWVKALHAISVIAWMAGLLYLPRLFVYHCEAEAGSDKSETFKVMERRLLRAIMNPAMIATWVFGLMLFVHLGAWEFGWMHGKLALIAGLTVVHHMLAKDRKAFAADENTKSSRYYRILNEAPTLMMIGAVILVIVKPF
ncbi:MAG: protoporphyrinogen oxidase HemJ [Rhodovibrionaceae bacterium]|nr:protoporphyrinogen oxidase HemJ [Rhodovibrionaceae bacterium]